MPIDEDNELHLLLMLIEQMQREGRSEREIEAVIRDVTRSDRPAAPRSAGYSGNTVVAAA